MECAKLIYTQFKVLQLKTGIIISVPISKEEEANNTLIVKAID